MRIHKRQSNKGSTLIEMLVCFALLAIFMSAAAVVVANVTNVFFDVKGQTYGRQVAEIILGKISAEIEGAKLTLDDKLTQPVIFQSSDDAAKNNQSGYKMDLYDRTDTHIQMYAEDGELKVRYFEINPPKEGATEEYKAGHVDETIWTFDEGVYQGYKLTSLRFVRANMGFADNEENNDIEKNARDKVDDKVEMDYPGNVVGIYITLDSPQYGEFYAYRYVKMYNLTEEDAKKLTIPLKTTTEYN